MNMTQPPTDGTKLENPALLGDLRPVVGECGLIKLALQAVEETASGLPLRSGSVAGRFSHKMLLTLLTYSYAAGSYASEDIEWDCQHDAAARYLSGNPGIDQDTLRAFRRANRPWIEACLAWVLDQVRMAKPADGNRTECARAMPASPSDLCCLGLARRRVELAALMDMAMSD